MSVIPRSFSTLIYIALGTNLGDRLANLQTAIAAFSPEIEVLRTSPIYETAPWGFLDQPAFLNQVVEVRTRLSPPGLLARLKGIEQQMGRMPTFPNGPRLIDLDILFYGDLVIDTPPLQIPHPRMADRAFVLAPLADIAPDLVHPILKISIRDMLNQVDQSGIKVIHPPHLSGLTFGARTFIMGVINVTPDSFSGDGLFHSPDLIQTALQQAREFIKAGADVIDIGGESTRPGNQPVSAQQEMERVLPVIEAIAEEIDAPISIDTYKASVAEAALRAGAKWINDVWGLRADSRMASVAARYRAPLIVMHNRSNPADVELRERLGGRYTGSTYTDLLGDIRAELRESVALARAAGVPDTAIILDPGIGFGKTVEQNLELIDRLDEICVLGYPVLLGPSRKSFIGYTLNLPPDQRVEGTAAAVAVGIVRGADIIRVHDVAVMARVARMTDAIVRRKR